jgi:hypothetical protein
MKKIIIVLSSQYKIIFAQGDRRCITYGLFAGVPSILRCLIWRCWQLRFTRGYTLAEAKLVATAGFLINWKYPYAKVSIQVEISYTNQGTDLNYQDDEA